MSTKNQPSSFHAGFFPPSQQPTASILLSPTFFFLPPNRAFFAELPSFRLRAVFLCRCRRRRRRRFTTSHDEKKKDAEAAQSKFNTRSVAAAGELGLEAQSALVTLGTTRTDGGKEALCRYRKRGAAVLTVEGATEKGEGRGETKQEDNFRFSGGAIWEQQHRLVFS